MTQLSDEPPPDWSLLPHDPAAFFGLADPIDRKDLKRAYNRLLRRFKPEKAPEEFQRIRAAYEALDERLRYGDQTGPVPRQSVKWEDRPQETAPAPQSDESRPATRKERPKKKPLAERLESEAPQELYRELAAIENKNPFEYYALAVLSDVVERDKPLRFVEWLLSALKSHPDDGALWRLLHDYLRGPLPPGAEEKLLPVIAKLAQGDFFYPLTEPLWLSLLRHGKGAPAVEQFATLLKRCQRELRDQQISGRLAFSIQLAKAALLKGDHPWSHETIDYIEANFEQVPPWLEPDLDLLGLLREYAHVRDAFAAGHPLRQQLDQALQAYFLEDQQQGDRAVVAAQVAIASDADALMAAFPLSDNELFSPFYALWMWVSWDVGERNAAPAQEITGPRPNWSSRVRELMVQLDRRANGSKTGYAWSAMNVAYRSLQGAVLLLPTIFLSGIATATIVSISPTAPAMVYVIAIAVVGAGGIYVGWKGKLWIEEHWWNNYCRRTSSRIYHQMWRPEILKLQQRSHLDGDDFRALFEQSIYSDLSMSGYISAYVQQDYAPALLSIAQKFMA